MNQPAPQDEMVNQTPPTDAPMPQRRFPIPLGMVLLVAFCGLGGPACYFGLAILRNYGLLS